MPKTRRVQIRLTDEDHALLMDLAREQGGITNAFEAFLYRLRPAKIIGVRPMGVRGRVIFSIRFTNEMVVHGFIWSRGGQLLGPRHMDDGHWVHHMGASRECWRRLRQFCRDWFTTPVEVEPEPEYEEVR